MKNFYQLLMQYWLSFKLLLLRYDEDCCRKNKHIVKHIWASKWEKIKQSEAEFKKVRAYKKKRVYDMHEGVLREREEDGVGEF